MVLVPSTPPGGTAAPTSPDSGTEVVAPAPETEPAPVLGPPVPPVLGPPVPPVLGPPVPPVLGPPVAPDAAPGLPPVPPPSTDSPASVQPVPLPRTDPAPEVESARVAAPLLVVPRAPAPLLVVPAPAAGPRLPGSPGAVGEAPRAGSSVRRESLVEALQRTPGRVARALAPAVPGLVEDVQVPQAVVQVAGETLRRPALPLGMIAIVVGFVLVQGRIDRKDPKLAEARLESEPLLHFRPLPG